MRQGMNQQPIISVVICTYNNADSLAVTLQQLLSQQIVDLHQVEILLIDNNSPDHTKTVCRKFIEQTNITASYLFEGRQGLSHARNTGVENAQGHYILFTDDDAELLPNWINTYLLHIAATQADCLYSKINIIWDKAKPWWFLPEYTPCFVGLDYGNEAIKITDIHKEFYGKNFCIKKSLIITLGGFDPALGRNGSKLIAGEETLLYRKMIEQKNPVFYFPNAPVGHRLKEREYLAENIKKQFIDGAYSIHHIAALTARKKILGRPARAFIDSLRILVKSIALLVFYWIKGNKPYCYYHQLNMLKNITFIKLWISSK
jgi:glucosyl-dolichyl phosphate glucuronosyltransferase